MKRKRVKQREDLSQIHTILQSIDINNNERFHWGWETLAQDQKYDWKFVKKDVSFNLKDDLTYIDRLRKNNNPLELNTEDQKILENELSRMKKIYTYKINYLTIKSQLRKVEEKQKIELAQIEKIYSTKINLLKYETPKPLHFRKSTTAGYIMKMERWAQRSHDQKIMERKRVLEKEKEEVEKTIKKKEENLIEEVTRFLNIDARYIDLIKAGVMLLPSNSRLAAIFPKSKWLTFNNSNKNDRHEVMYLHARQLLMDHMLFTKSGILPIIRKGCICIMYIKEGHMKDSVGATFRPVFGASGIKPYGKNKEQEIEKNSYISMGVPDPMEISDISYEKTAKKLLKHVDIMQRLGIKPPSMQSSLYFLQTPEYRENKNKGKNDTLENWAPSNCAEPAIMTAIYQMYSRPADIYLSVPFEGYLSNGELLLKYTCARCALSEPAFMSPDDSPYGQRLTDMRLQSNRSPLISDRILSDGLMYNHAKKENNEEDKAHPYSKRSDVITRTVLSNQGHGFGHVKRGHEQFAMYTTFMLAHYGSEV